ncbi:MAG: beta-lactamase family protein [Streptomyces sp.]|nr:beta-lactamase family protein [Streptomyces sp.]
MSEVTTETVLRSAVEWLVSALAGRMPLDRIHAGLASRLTARGDIGSLPTTGRRLAAFREHQPQVDEIEVLGVWEARATARTGTRVGELDVAVAPDPPHRIKSFQPRPAAPDAVEWTRVADRLRARDSARPDLPEHTAKRIHARLLAGVEADRIVGLTCGVSVHGTLVHSEYLGAADLASLTPLQPRSLFPVGSVTKTVTALGVLALAESGAVDPDAPLTRYLSRPDLIPAAAGDPRPTIGQLPVHRAGLPKDLAVPRAAPAAATSPEDAAPRTELAWAPGTRAEYSDVGYALLGRLIEAVSGRLDHTPRSGTPRPAAHPASAGPVGAGCGPRSRCPRPAP